MNRRELLVGAAVAPLVGIARTGFAAAAPPGRRPGNAHMYALGDSRTYDNFRNGYPSLGPLSITRQLALGRLIFDSADCNGLSGADTTRIRQEMGAALSSEAKILALLAGTNDRAEDVRSGRTLKNLRAMARDWVESAPDRVVLLADECPAGPDYASHTTKLIPLRDGLRALVDPAKGIYHWPSWNTVATKPDGREPKATAYRDDLHWATGGAWAVGRAAWQVLEPLLPEAQDDSWRAIGGASPRLRNAKGVLAETVELDGAQWIKLTTNGNSGLHANIICSDASIPASLNRGWDGLQFGMRYKVEAGSSNLRAVSCILREDGATPLYSADGDDVRDGSFIGGNDYARLGPMPSDAIDAMLLPPTADIPAKNRVYRWEVDILGFEGVPCDATVWLRYPPMARIEALRWPEE